MALNENGLSIADAMALTGNNRPTGGFLGGEDSWVFFLFFLLAWGGGLGGGFGGTGSAVHEGELTRAELYNSLGQQDSFNNQRSISNELSAFERDAANNWGQMKYENLQGVNALQRDIAAGFGTVNANLAENRFAQQQCCCETNRNIDAVRYDNAKNVNDIIAATNANTQRIMDMITQNQIQALRDELLAARSALSNNTQTQNILSALQPVPRPAYITGSPYAVTNNYCGCGV